MEAAQVLFRGSPVFYLTVMVTEVVSFFSTLTNPGCINMLANTGIYEYFSARQIVSIFLRLFFFLE